MAGKGSSRDASGADKAGTDWHGKSLKLRQCLRVALAASRLDQERKPQNVYRNYGFRVDSETAGFLNGYTPARFETGIILNGTPTTEAHRSAQNGPAFDEYGFARAVRHERAT